MPERRSAPSDRIGIGIHAALILALGLILGATILRASSGPGAQTAADLLSAPSPATQEDR